MLCARLPVMTMSVEDVSTGTMVIKENTVLSQTKSTISKQSHQDLTTTAQVIHGVKSHLFCIPDQVYNIYLAYN